MTAQSIYIVLCLCAIMCSAFSSYEADVFSKRSTKKYCGETLNQALKMICHSYYNSMFINKRNGGDQETIDIGEYANERGEHLVRVADMDAFVAAIQSLRYPFASKATSLTMLPRPSGNGNYLRERRGTRGVYDECCLKMCSINELATYCGEGV